MRIEKQETKTRTARLGAAQNQTRSEIPSSLSRWRSFSTTKSRGIVTRTASARDKTPDARSAKGTAR
jgi:hypothetical protein